MPAKTRIPSYRLHRPSGNAVVTIAGKDHYLGRHGTAASKAAYGRLVAELVASPTPGTTRPAAGTVSVQELLAAYWQHARQKYGHRRSARTRLSLIKRGTRHLRKLYGDTDAAAFGPLGLRAIRAKYVEADHSRAYVNELTAVIVRLFKWAASVELVPPATYQALTTVGGLARGDGEARETEPVRPVDPAFVEAVKPRLSRQVVAMIDLQILTGMRPGEAVQMRPCDLDTGGELWTYRPRDHKTERFGIDRAIVLGPQAQAIVRPFLLGRAVDAYLFSPREADVERRAALTVARKTPRHYGNGPGTNRKRRPRRSPGAKYTTVTYARAIRRACEELGITRWAPNQLRHLAATAIRKQFGAEAARILLGHTHLKVTEIYAERDHEVARRVAAAVG